ncbi:hypothetical protein POTOM_030191 [Populus tomentosa]|uniref:Pentatricopeptide repeat-containing protein n=1 Tax=Populus tomentosa TaxID=118781 RepID=A0A8X7ZCD7_POPTO|nr:hypothetical protein POTOM_030191 [Populus tomentosa]
MGLVGLYHQSGLYDDVLHLFEEMRNSNLKPGEKSALVTMNASCGCLDIAEELFTRISSKNLVVLTAMVSGYSRVERVEDARFVCYHVYEKDLVFSRLGYAESDKPQEALNFFSQMQVLGIKPDQVTILSVISASARLGILDLLVVSKVYGMENIVRDRTRFHLHTLTKLACALVTSLMTIGPLLRMKTALSYPTSTFSHTPESMYWDLIGQQRQPISCEPRKCWLFELSSQSSRQTTFKHKKIYIMNLIDTGKPSTIVVVINCY